MEYKALFAILLFTISFRFSYGDFHSPNSDDEGTLGDDKTYDSPGDCSDIQSLGYKSGLYSVRPVASAYPFYVYCDLDTDGGMWTVIQHRVAGKSNFDTSYDTYEHRFPENFDENLEGDYWVGLKSLHELTKNKNYELYIEMTTINNKKKTANYKTFRVGSDFVNYILFVGNYTGEHGDLLKQHNLKPFSTPSSATDIGGGCNEKYKGGWWGDICQESNLNGMSLTAAIERIDNENSGKIAATKMMIRPIKSIDPGEVCSTKSQIQSLNDRVAELYICSCHQRKEEIEALLKLTKTSNAEMTNLLKNRFNGVDQALNSLDLNPIFEKYGGRLVAVENTIVERLTAQMESRFEDLKHQQLLVNEQKSELLSDVVGALTTLTALPVDKRLVELKETVDRELQQIVNALKNVTTGAIKVDQKELHNRINAAEENISKSVTEDLDKRFKKIENLEDVNNSHVKKRLVDIEAALNKITANSPDERIVQLQNNVDRDLKNIVIKLNNVTSATQLDAEDLRNRLHNITSELNQNCLNNLNNRFKEMNKAIDIQAVAESNRIEKLEKMIVQLIEQNEELIKKMNVLKEELATTPAPTTPAPTTPAPTTPPPTTPTPKVIAEDCSQLKVCKAGFYEIQPKGASRPFSVFCNDNKWATIQIRVDGTVDFYRNYAEYQNGFGTEKEFWLGLENIYQMTKNGEYELLIEMKDFDRHGRYAQYSTFNISDAKNGYKLRVGGYKGNAGDSLSYSNGFKFSTHDNENDASTYNCAVHCHGAWWYNRCHQGNLNGKYLTGGLSDGKKHYAAGVVWGTWRGWSVSLKSTRMMIGKRNITSVPCEQ